MNLSISPMNNVSFGMAKFSQRGKEFAEASGEKGWNRHDNPRFYKNPVFIKKPDIAKYIEAKIPLKTRTLPGNIEKVEQAIIDHGTGTNAEANAKFVRQVIDPRTQRYIDKLGERKSKAQDVIISAEKALFDANWDNPMLSKAETMTLLDTVKSKMADAEYVKWTGIIERSDAV